MTRSPSGNSSATGGASCSCTGVRDGLYRYRRAGGRETHNVSLVLEGNVRYGHLIPDRDLLFGTLVVLDQSTRVQSLQSCRVSATIIHPIWLVEMQHTLEWTDVQDSVDVAGNDTKPLRVVMLNLVGLLFPPNGSIRVVGLSDNLVLSAKRDHFILERVVADAHDKGFVEVRPVCECSLANDLLGNLVGRPALALGRSDSNDHALVSRVGVEHAHTVIAERTIVRDRVQRRESGEGLVAKMRAVQKTKNELDTIAKGREVEWLGSRARVGQVGEEARLRRRVEVVARFIVGKLRALYTRSVSLLLLVCQTDIAGWPSQRQPINNRQVRREYQNSRAMARSRRAWLIKGILTTASQSCFLPFMSSSNSRG